MSEVPPTAGLPLGLGDFLPRHTASLETPLASFLQVPFVQIECSGTAALVVILTALAGRDKRRRVIIPAYTCPLVLLAVLHCRLEPVLCDLQPGHFDFDQQALSRLSTEDTLAVIPTHLGGRVANIQHVIDIARRSGSYVIEDAAQAMGATYQGRPVGMIGDAGFYSLAVGKGLTLFEGGVLLASSEALQTACRETAEKIIPRNRPREALRLTQLLGYAALYRPKLLGIAYGIPLRRALRHGKLIEAVGDDFSSDIPLHRVGAWRKSVGALALRRLPGFLSQLNALAERRLKRFAAIPNIAILTDGPDTQGTWPFFMIVMPNRAARDAALEKLWTSRLGVSRLYINALADYPYLKTIASAEIPNARDFAERMLTVSNSPWLTETEFESICQLLESAANTAALHHS